MLSQARVLWPEGSFSPAQEAQLATVLAPARSKDAGVQEASPGLISVSQNVLNRPKCHLFICNKGGNYQEGGYLGLLLA